MCVLIVEDDPDLSAVLQETFLAAGRDVQLCGDGEDALSRAQDPTLDAIVLDVMLPVYSGFEVCQRLREQGITTPILMLTCRDRESDMLRGLRLGADDYMSKPFSTAELTARIDALVRRAGGFRQRSLRCGELVLDLGSRRVRHGGRPVEMTAREFDLLAYFLQNCGRAVTREDVLARVWGDSGDHTTNLVDVYVGYLRRKLAQAGCPDLLRTVRGYGYILSARD